MTAITRLCERTVLLEQGNVLQDGPSHKVIGAYLNSGLGTSAAREWPDLTQSPGNEIVRLCAVRVRTQEGTVTDAVDIRRPVGIEMEYEVLEPGHVLVPNYHFYNEEGICAFVASDHAPDWRQRPRPVGRYVSTAWLPGNMLSEGTLIVGAAISTMDPVVIHFHERDAVAFQVVDSLDGDSARGDYAGPFPGVVRPLLEWTTNHQTATRETAIVTEGATV
jgi:lipopolysaccharide transport system ATP-binding protein